MPHQLYTDGLPELYSETPHSARIHDDFLGGRHHYPADRMAADQIVSKGDR